MTLSTTVARVDYAGNGSTTAFPVPFAFFGLDELQVIERTDATGIEFTLTRGAQYTVSGGDGSPGTVTAIVAPAAGKRWAIIRATARTQGADYVENDPFPAETHERALDRLTAIAQEVEAANTRNLRVPATDSAAGLVIPSSVDRANKVLAFDASGVPTVLSQLDKSLDTVQPTGGTVAQSLAALLRAANPRFWGAIGDGVADDTAAMVASAQYASANGLMWEVPEGTFRTVDTVTVTAAAAGIEMRGSILYAGTHDRAALVIGNVGGPRASQKIYRGLNVAASTQSPWNDERSIGINMHNFDACWAEVRRVQGFNIGVRTEGSGVFGSPAGFEDSDLHLGRLVNNRFGLDIHCSQPGPYAWNNSVRYYGGHFANAGSCNPTISRYGVRLGRAAGAYALHNAHTFHGPAFELQNGYQTGGPGSAVDAIPFLNATAGRAVVARSVRMEGCSPFVAEHRNAGLNSDVPARIDAQDCVYEVLYASNGSQPNIGGLPQGDAYLIDVKYATGCNRAGGTVIRMAQSAAASRCTRLLAELPSARAGAFQWRPLLSSPEVGFDGMAVLSSNVPGATTLTALAFPGLDNFTPVGDGIRFPTSRAIGWVVRTETCKEFEVAFDGNRCRPFVMIFDAAENVITPTLITDPDGTRTAATTTPPLPPGIFDPDPDPNRPDFDPDPDITEQPGGTTVPDPAGPVVLFSNAGTLYNSNAKWWVAGSEPQDFTVSRLQRITLPAAAKFAIIGVTSLGAESGDADADGVSGELHLLRSVRLYCPPEYAPGVIFGGSRTWGSRELSGSATFDPPSLANGAATVSLNTGRSSGLVSVPGVRPGDFIQVGWIPGSGFQTGGFIFHGMVGATSELGGSSASELVTVTVHNLSGGTNDLPSGTIFVRATKQKL